MSAPDLNTLEGMVLDRNEPVFNEPWEAQAFAMTIALYEQEVFTWEEWAAALSAQIHGGETRDYYQHWLAALEAITQAKGITSASAIDQREQDWHAAAARTPHGEPIEL
ncbi:nitrile hydratase accessory protein [Pseudahrensia aquimaris]|uniref:Nitrile hydratase accessory protein n=1 Tax=Pseudahrensia aquimaris TaxID=744461 RepID=A0ABW3FA39_9HYPH